MTSLVEDAAYPQSAPLQPGVIVTAGYIGGDAYHVWDAADWARWNTRYRVPIWVRSDPASVSAASDAEACLNALVALGAPAPYRVTVYGSDSTLFANPALDGYWVALYNNDPALTGNASEIGHQFISSSAGYDESVLSSSVATWDTQTGKGPTLVMLDIETAQDAAWVEAFAAVVEAYNPDPPADPPAESEVLATAQYSDGRIIIARPGTDNNVYITEQATAGGPWTRTGNPAGGTCPVPGPLAIAVVIVSDTPSVYVESADPATAGNGNLWSTWKASGTSGAWVSWDQLD